MSVEGISRKDWNRVHEAALLITNATLCDNNVLSAHYTQSLMGLLDELEVHYGRNSAILSTRADYLDDISEAIALHEEAIQISGSVMSRKLSLQSLIRLMIEGGYEQSSIKLRLDDLEEATDSNSEDSDRKELQELRKLFKSAQAK